MCAISLQSINKFSYYNDLENNSHIAVSHQNIQQQTALLSILSVISTQAQLVISSLPRDPGLVQLEVLVGQGFPLHQAIQLLGIDDKQSKHFQTIINLSKSSQLDTHQLLQFAQQLDNDGQPMASLAVCALLNGEAGLLQTPPNIRDQAEKLKNAVLSSVGAGYPRPRGVRLRRTPLQYTIYRSVRDVGHAAQDPYTIASLMMAGMAYRVVKASIARAGLGESAFWAQAAKVSGVVVGTNVEAGVFTVSQMLPELMNGQTHGFAPTDISWKRFWSAFQQNLVMVASLKAGGALFGQAAEAAHGVSSYGVATRGLEFAKFNIEAAKYAGSFWGMLASNLYQNPNLSWAENVTQAGQATVAYGLAGHMGIVAVGPNNLSYHKNVTLSDILSSRGEAEGPSFRNFLKEGSSLLAQNDIHKLEMTLLEKTSSWFPTFLGPNFATAGIPNYIFTSTLKAPKVPNHYMMSADVTRTGGSKRSSRASQLHEQSLKNIADIYQYYSRNEVPYVNDLRFIQMAKHVDPDVKIDPANLEVLRKISLPAAMLPDVKINGVPMFMHCKTLGDLVPALWRLHDFIHSSAYLKIEVGDKLYEGAIYEMGRGVQGIAYAIGHQWVIKLPYPSYNAVASLMMEQQSSEFWHLFAGRHGFTTVKELFMHPLGFFSIRQRAKGQSMEVFLKQWALQDQPLPAWFEQLKSSVENILAINRKYPMFAYSLHAENVFVQFDAQGRPKLELFDYGLPIYALTPLQHFNRFKVNDLLYYNPLAGVEISHQKQLWNTLTRMGIPEIKLLEVPYLLLKDIFLVRQWSDYLDYLKQNMQLRSSKNEAVANQFKVEQAYLFQGIHLEEGDLVGLSEYEQYSVVTKDRLSIPHIGQVGIVLRKNNEWYLATYQKDLGYYLMSFSQLHAEIELGQRHYIVMRTPWGLSEFQKHLLREAALNIADGSRKHDEAYCSLSVHHLFKKILFKLGKKIHDTPNGDKPEFISSSSNLADMPILPESYFEHLKLLGHNWEGHYLDGLGIRLPGQLKHQYVWVRHGQAQHNIEEVLRGDYAMDQMITNALTQKGREDVIANTKQWIAENKELILEKYRQQKLMIVASPFLRTQQTAELIAATLASELSIPKPEIHADERLREKHFGEFEGQPAQTLRDAQQLQSKQPVERSLAVYQRIFEFINDYEASLPENDYLVLTVSHNITIRLAFGMRQGVEPSQTRHMRDSFGNATFHVFPKQ